jgi:hypothetical protein
MAQGVELASYRDASGKITTTVFGLNSRDAQAHNNDFEVELPSDEPDMIVVGGGGRANWDMRGTDQAKSGRGGLLFASYPRQDQRAWLLSTKDHVYPSPHTVTAFAIGLKIRNLTLASLQKLFTVRTAEAAYKSGNDPDRDGIPGAAAYVRLDPGHRLLGGGFKAVPSGRSGLLAYVSEPQNNNGWIATARDYVHAEDGKVTAYAIAVAVDDARKFNLTLRTTAGAIRSDLGPFPEVRAMLPDGFALCGGGARVELKNGDKGKIASFPWAIEPMKSNRPGFLAATKSHHNSDVVVSTVVAWAYGIQAD